MMKYPERVGIFAVLSAVLFIGALCPSKADARIGERRESIEKRLFASGGIVYRDDASQAKRRKGMPYLPYFELLPGSADVRIYYKTADGDRPTTSDLEKGGWLAGWDMHVVYVNGVSAIEVYKRSQSISEFELNRLLALNAGGSHWTKVVDKKEQEGTVFGFDMVRADGAVRAKKDGGDRVVFFSAKIDTVLAEREQSDLLEKAPLSVQGF